MTEVWLELSHTEQERIKTYMRSVAREHCSFGEVNVSDLAMDACDELKAWVGDDIPENYFELALEVSDE